MPIRISHLVARRSSTLWPWAVLMLAGCAAPTPVQLYQLPADPPAAATSGPPVVTAGDAWVLGLVQLPEYLDRDAVLRPTGQTRLAPLPGQRWAEPLRDAIPRVLLQDLARLRGTDQVWRGPAPAGVTVQHQLRVEVQQFNARADGQAVVLQARWMLVDPRGQKAPLVRDFRVDIPVAGAGTDALVAAHRDALWQLAKEIAAQGG